MKLFAPKYYKDFSCIAEKCSHNCCIGWEIDIDSNTMERYSSLCKEKSYALELIKSIDTEDGTPHFILGDRERCPHLDSRGLCSIITELGEDLLCEICREHPRFYNDTYIGKEVGLGMACEEACRIILDSSEYNSFVEIDELCGKPLPCDFDTLEKRTRLYDILGNDMLLHTEKLNIIYREFGISPQALSDNEWRDMLFSLEYLEDSHKKLFSSYSSDISTPRELEKTAERALAYYIFRHCTEALDENEYRASLGFCLFCERLLVSVLKAEGISEKDKAVTIARIISEELEYSEENTETIKNEIYFSVDL